MSRQEPPNIRELELARKRDRLAQLQNPMLRAMEHMKSKEYLEESLAVLEKISKVVQSGKMNHDEALLCIGRIMQILEDWRGPQNVIDEFNSLARTLNINQVNR